MVRVVLMTVDAEELNGLSVNKELAVFDFNFAETNPAAFDLDDLTVIVLEGKDESVEVGRFGGPLMGISEFCLEQCELDIASLRIPFTTDGQDISDHRFIQNRYCFLVVELGLDGPSLEILAAVVGDFGTDHHSGIDVAVVEVCLNKEIKDMDLWSSKEVDVSIDTAEPPHVLVFKITAVGPAVDFDGECIFARLEVLGDIEFGWCHTILAVADLSPVDPDVEGAFNAVEVQENPAAFPLVADNELSSVGADRIVFVGDMRRIWREGIWDIEVNRDSIAVHLPVGWDGNFTPVADIVFGPVKIDGPVTRFTDPVELPVAVE